MKNLHEILELADQELGSVAQSGRFRSREEIHSVYELIDIVKDIYCIWDYEDSSEEMSEKRSHDGYSYARGRKRDSMGRYSRRGYSRDGKEEYIEHLRDMAEDAPDEQTRQSIHRMIDQMK